MCLQLCICFTSSTCKLSSPEAQHRQRSLIPSLLFPPTPLTLPGAVPQAFSASSLPSLSPYSPLPHRWAILISCHLTAFLALLPSCACWPMHRDPLAVFWQFDLAELQLLGVLLPPPHHHCWWGAVSVIKAIKHAADAPACWLHAPSYGHAVWSGSVLTMNEIPP